MPLMDIANNAQRNRDSGLTPSKKAMLEAKARMIELISVLNAAAYEEKQVISELEKVYPDLRFKKSDIARFESDFDEILSQFNYAINFTHAYIDNVEDSELKRLLGKMYHLEFSQVIRKIDRKQVTKTAYRLVPQSEEIRTWPQARARIVADIYMTQPWGFLGESIAVCLICGRAFEIRKINQWCDTLACLAHLQVQYPRGIPAWGELDNPWFPF